MLTPTKKILLLFLLIFAGFTTLNAQDNNSNNDYAPTAGFKKENVFIGGSLGLGFGSGSFNVGANPEIGYSFSKWFDAGVAFNINYASQKFYNYDGSTDYKVSSFNYGAGVFGRFYPVPFLFVQAQPEVNWISYKQKDYASDLSYKNTVSAVSLIGGIGYSQRIVGEGSYFLMIGLDLLQDTYSPYLDGYGHAVPIIRGGFDIYLHPSRRARSMGPEL